MQPESRRGRAFARLTVLALILGVGVFATPAFAGSQGAALPSPQAPPADQAPLPYPPGQAPTYPPQELDRIVSPIALYPDPLLGMILTASTFSPQIPDAARWSDQHHYVAPAALPAEIAADQVPWEPSVQALLPFPSVLDMMASDMPWTQELGSAFLVGPQGVMDAVQRMRQLASNYGYLRSNQQVTVSGGPYIEIEPVNPAFIVVPYYSPGVVFVAPARGFAVASAIRFGFGVSIGTAFAPWGWGSTRFAWGSHALFVNNAAWGRTWANRATYVHPFVGVRRYAGARPVEHHEVIVRSQQERQAQRSGRGQPEEHKQKDERK